MSTPAHQMAKRIALNLLDGPTPTPEHLKACVAQAATAVRAINPTEPVDEVALVRELEASLNVFQADSVTLENDDGHIPWLDERSAEIKWSFWDRYIRYLAEEEGLPPLVLDRLDSSTRRVLQKLEDPNRHGAWDRRGLVVGQVQSGKTGNYTGLVCKAADAGYRFIIVLAGMHNSLRSQTQLRLDMGFLGFDTQLRQVTDTEDGFSEVALGVGRLVGAEGAWACSLTSSEERGDFRKAQANRVQIGFGGPLPGPVLLVVKKNVSILKNLLEWLQTVVGTGESRRIREHALLMIDDEADNASINTNRMRDQSGAIDPDYDPTRVNASIRRLINIFDKRAYVGYTATPFANIYVEQHADDEFGKDLFPESFIDYLRPPTNYFGPSRLFGLDDLDPLPLHRPVTDSGTWMPDKHKVTHDPSLYEPPASLRTAILSFILARAARLARGQRGRHNSMLVHVSRFRDVQGHVRRQVEDELESIRARIRYGDGSGASILDEFEELWERDFEPTSEQFDDGTTAMVFDQVRPFIEESVTPIEIKTINGDAQDALEYYERRRDGLNVIAIGGDKLSRGLTLEGLSVSYYLRASRTFDTLMQMGRWFGYRPGYEDLCRLYTSSSLWACYREVTLANEELIAEFEEMAQRRRTPREYGLKVRNSVLGMLVTAPNKMRSATNLRLGFAGTISETVVLHAAKTEADHNFSVANDFVGQLGEPDPGRPGRSKTVVWSGVSGQAVANEFFDRYITPQAAWRVHAQTIGKYIKNCLAIGELKEWTIVLASSTAAQHFSTIGGQSVGLTRRSLIDDDMQSKLVREGTYSIRRILSPHDEQIDFESDEIRRLTQLTVDAWHDDPGRRKSEPTMPSGTILRRARPSSRGLLIIYPLEPVAPDLCAQALGNRVELSSNPLIGFAVSFPSSENAEAVEYTANRTYLDELFGADDEVDE